MVMRAQYNLKLEVQKQKKQGLENHRESMEFQQESKSRAAQPEIQVGGRKRNNHQNSNPKHICSLFRQTADILLCG
jgi:hypothetical protein